MGTDNYNAITSGQQNKKCFVETGPLMYEGIYLKDSPSPAGISMIIRITDDYKKTLQYVATEDGTGIKNNIIGIPISVIKSITFEKP